MLPLGSVLFLRAKLAPESYGSALPIWLQKRLLVGTDVYCEKGLRAKCEEKDPSSLVSLKSLPFKEKKYYS